VQLVLIGTDTGGGAGPDADASPGAGVGAGVMLYSLGGWVPGHPPG
jgi:hypothetical protein